MRGHWGSGGGWKGSSVSNSLHAQVVQAQLGAQRAGNSSSPPAGAQNNPFPGAAFSLYLSLLASSGNVHASSALG